MRVQSPINIQKMMLENTGDMLEELKKRDKDMTCHHDEDLKAFTKLQLPKDLEDLNEDWLIFD